MRILIVHNILWAHYKSVVFQALQRLVDQRPDVTVLVLQIARNERSRAGLEAEVGTTAPTYAYDYDLLFDRYLEDVTLAERMQALLQKARKFRPDVIHLTGYYDPAQLLLLGWAKVQGIPVVMQNESTAVDHKRGSLKEYFKRFVFSQCAGFFCFGSQSAQYLIQLGVKPAKILLQKNAVDNATLRSVYEKSVSQRSDQQQALSLRQHNFIFVGRLIEFKNLPTLITAFAQAITQSAMAHQWGLVLLGDGVEKDSLQTQINALNLTDRVTLLSGRPWFRVPEILALSDVLVLPSRSEPWGLVVNEAMACSLPAIVSERCGCVPDLVHDGQNGFVFNPDQPAQLADQLKQVMDGLVDLKRMKNAAEQSVVPYSPEAVAQEMFDGFSKITT